MWCRARQANGVGGRVVGDGGDVVGRAAAAAGGCRLQQRRRLVDKAEKFVGADSAGPPEHSRLVCYPCARVYVFVCALACLCARPCAREFVDVCVCATVFFRS